MSGGDTWTPNSPCDTSCLPDRGSLPRATFTCRLRRVLGLAVLLVYGAMLASAMPVLPASLRRIAARTWFTGVLAALGVRLRVRGAPPPRTGTAAGALVVANHVSWLDVLALQAVCPMRLLAKVEVRHWPLLGRLAVRAGTLFIERERPTRLPAAIGSVTEALRHGHVVGAFPEGTTRCGRASGQYRSAVFQAALEAGAPVRPVALRYELMSGEPTTVAAFVGEDTLLASLREVLAVRGLVVELIQLPSPGAPATAAPGMFDREPGAVVLHAPVRTASQRETIGYAAARRDASAARRALASYCARVVTEACEPRPPGNHWTCTAVEVATSCGDRSERSLRDDRHDGTGARKSTVVKAVP
ncbi:1-acyl-sn-glycerol-3-phosphate acyltransferases [Actinopolyspora mzabensis]|uniref:1-acyl-sn-glycerol-3-phosphate acyltransferases n=1 Tax=Actinopolyspora mzabensis TaxID=995066 RepID=A0A1G9DQ41_ACTMZ|nr:lysophospholipid acyltransferase family protein [Actinopolyspora mzabensis]SDK65969.1 1-acyl-sn-glycerol-3-phosphate acyltransferases [Actinopolyspora mzabensis]